MPTAYAFGKPFIIISCFEIGDRVKNYTILASEILHFLSFLIKMPKTQLENGMFITSIDVDVGKKELGLLNRGRNDMNISSRFSEFAIGEIEEQALPIFIDLFNNFGVPATFALRGQLLDVDASIMNCFDKSIKHDIGAHGYHHKLFTRLSSSKAEDELRRISMTMKRFDIRPRSFVFPKNCVAHLNLLEKYGYKCYRGSGGLIKDRMQIEMQGSLFNVCPSIYIDRGLNYGLLKRILDLSIDRKLPFHIWFHFWNLGDTRESLKRSVKNILFPLLRYVSRKQRNGILTCETMLSAAEKFEKFSCGRKDEE